MMPDLDSFQQTVLVGAVLVLAAALGTFRKKKREQRINAPADPMEIRRRRLAKLQSSQVCDIR